MRGKKSIILLHGWTRDITRLKLLANELEKLSWSVHLVKLPGLTSEDPGREWNLNDYAKYIENKFIKKENFFVFGHSFGGRIAIKLAEKCSDHLYGIILCGAGGLSRPNIVKRTAFNFLANIGKIFIFMPLVARIFRKSLYRLAHEHDYEKANGIMKDVFKKVVSEDLKPLVGQIKIPLLTFWGKLDRMVSVQDAYFIKKVLPNSKLVIFDSEGHTLQYQKPEELAREIEKWYQSIK